MLDKRKDLNKIVSYIYNLQCFHGRDHTVDGFITTCAISAYHHWSCEFESYTGEVYLIQYYVIKFVSDLRRVGGFLRVNSGFLHQ